jgi:hypothetical protein
MPKSLKKILFFIYFFLKKKMKNGHFENFDRILRKILTDGWN